MSEKTIVDFKRELDEAEAALNYAAQMNVHPSVPIEKRIGADVAYQRAQNKYSEAMAAYRIALTEASKTQ